MAIRYQTDSPQSDSLAACLTHLFISDQQKPVIFG